MNDELTDSQVRELTADLQKWREELQALLASSSAGARPVDLDTSIGRLSRMEAIQQQQMTQASRREAEQNLRRIEAALEAADADEYGYCRRCDEPIGYPRLKAQPAAVMCIDCRTELE